MLVIPRDLFRARLGRCSVRRLLPTAALGLACALLAPDIAVGEEPYVTISDADCQRMTRHIPSADVAYQPGIDAHGKAVAPADLGANEPGGQPEIIMPRVVLIPIEVDLFDRFGIPADGTGFEADAFIGEVTVDLETGEAFFNGQPLQNEAEAELAVRCQRIIRSRQNEN